MARNGSVECTLLKSHAECSSQVGIDSKLRRAFDLKTKLEQDKLRKLKEKRQKEEIRKKNAAEIAANKRKKEEMERRDREQKRKRLEEAQKQKNAVEITANKRKKEEMERRDREEKRKRFEEAQKQKNAAEIAANKRKKEEMDRRDREEKRKQLEEEKKQQKKLAEKLPAKKEAQEQRRQSLAPSQQYIYPDKIFTGARTCNLNKGKRAIKVKALKASEVAKRFEEEREQERKIRKELAKRGEHEKKKSNELYRGEIQGKRDIKVKALEAAEAAKRLEEKREQERKNRKDKMKKEQMHKRLEEAQKQQKELEQKLHAKKEAKEQRCHALVEYELKRKATEEKAKKQRHIDKEKEAARCRRRIEEDANSDKFASKDAKNMEEFYQHNGTTIQAQKAYVRKESSMSTSCANGAHETEGQSMLGSNASNINVDIYELSPYEEGGSNGSDEDSNDDVTPAKLIPLWARKENLIPHIISQQYIDPDGIFIGAKTCNLNEVFELNVSNRTRDFERRSNSGEWLNDCFTLEEELLYKLQMGYIN